MGYLWKLLVEGVPEIRVWIQSFEVTLNSK